MVLLILFTNINRTEYIWSLLFFEMRAQQIWNICFLLSPVSLNQIMNRLFFICVFVGLTQSFFVDYEINYDNIGRSLWQKIALVCTRYPRQM